MPTLRPKGGEELARDREQIEALLGPEVFYGEQLEDYDCEDMPARLAFMAHALRRARGIPNHLQQIERDRHLAVAMNRLQDYVAEAEADPLGSMLRPGQIPIMRSIADFFEDNAAARLGGHATLPTSVGKTVIFTELAHITGLRTLIVTPTKDLMFQTRKEFEKHAAGRHLDIGFVYGDEKRPGEHVTITPYASVTSNLRLPSARRVIKPEEYDLVVWDEVHEILGQQRRKAVHAFPRAIQIGFTATDRYSEHKLVSDVLPKVIERMDIIEGQDKRLVAPHRNIIVQTETDMREVYVASTGDYAEDVLYKTINTDRRNRTVVESYKKLFDGKKAIAYCAGIEHAKDLAAMFNRLGVPADHIDGTMSKSRRKDALAQLELRAEDGGLSVLCNDRILGAGTDNAAVEVVLLARPTVSPLRLLQNGGRSTRLWDQMPDKVGYILQYVDQNYVQPPMLYAEDEVSGYAQHGWDGFVFPKIDEHGYDVSHTRLIADPDEVKDLADSFADARNLQPRDPPENWEHLEAVAKRYGISKNRVYQSMQRLELALNNERRKVEADPKRQDELDELFDASGHKGRYMRKGEDATSRLYLSQDLITRLESYMYQYEVVPSPLWRNIDEVAALYGRSNGWVNTAFLPRQLREQYPDECGKYVVSQEHGNSRLYFSPTLLQVAAESGGFEDYSLSPPADWLPESSIIQEIGIEEYTLAFRRLTRYHAGRARVWYGNEMTRNGMFYCSRDYLRGIYEELEAPQSQRMRSLDEIAESTLLQGVTPQLLEQELLKLLEKELSFSEWDCGLYYPRSGKGKLVYYCTKRIEAHIRENAIRFLLQNRDEALIMDTLKQETDKDATAIEKKTKVDKPARKNPSVQNKTRQHKTTDDLAERTARVLQGTDVLLRQIRRSF